MAYQTIKPIVTNRNEHYQIPQRASEGSSCAMLPKHTQPASSAARVGPKPGRCAVLLSLYPTTIYSHRRGRKVIRMIIISTYPARNDYIDQGFWWVWIKLFFLNKRED